MAAGEDKEHVPLPPLVYLAGILLGLGIDYLIPIRVIPSVLQQPVGGVLMSLGLVIALLSVATLYRAGTSPLHERPTTNVVPGGVFNWSRNPIYVGMTLICVGLAFFFDRAWIIAGTVPAVLVIHFIVIAREEAFLEAKFGQAYLDYKRQVRRWI